MTDRYPKPGSDPRQLRSARANRRAAVLLIAGIVVIIVALAILV